MALSRCSKVLYCGYHFFFCIADITVIALTSYFLSLLFQYRLFLPVVLYLPSFLIIFFNFAQFFGLWQGISGIIKENKTAIIILCVSFIFNAVIDLFMGIWALNIYNEINETINTYMQYSYGNYTKLQLRKEEWNNMQLQLKCCGINGPDNYLDMGVDSVPFSCCSNSPSSTFCEHGVYKDGCLDSLTEFVHTQQNNFLVLILSFVIFQILAIGIFCNLYTVLSKYDIYEQYANKRGSTLLRRQSSVA